ncbi:ClpP/crotonase [Trametes versicolor FP-101664 SS1]|uniref:ClpP/crotonase n=1 Tax=Trametes versicolor (strain FP-101664) TaxID=717944 RepID=UPI0004624305|nr:ClpP/crotonase [Trametes versicolor FP-101664 SS1]EIW57361.1 ClpP/crotonase [Trametes versicolor FP-101664 SS1]
MSYPVSLPSENPLVTVTHPTPALWVLEMHNGADSRLTETFILKAFKPALDIVERHWRENWRTGQAKKDEKLCKGALIIVGNRKQDKFFSNGLDFAGASKDPTFSTNFFPVIFNPMLHRLLTFPIPTIAAVNGHAFAGGMALAMACDYRVMSDGSKRNAWLCMNEIHFGATLPLSLVAVLKAKSPNPQTLRKIVLEGHRFTPSECLSLGLVDRLAAGNTEGIVAEAQALAESIDSLPKLGVWGVNRRELYRDAIEALSKDVLIVGNLADDAAAKARL